MMKYIFIILLMIHVLCDFYFQTEKMADNKEQNFKWVLLHCALYAVIASIIIMTVMPALPWEYSLCFFVLHAVIDLTKYVVCNCKYLEDTVFVKNKRDIFATDQMLHVLTTLK